MAFEFEGDLLRQELRKGVGGVVSYRPQVAGVGATTPTGTPTFTVHRPNGQTIHVGDATVDGNVIKCAVQAIDDVESDYQVRITWTSDDVDGEQLMVVPFDVVLWPFGPIDIGMNDLLAARADLDRTLKRTGLRLGLDANADVAAERYASILAYRARIKLEGWLLNHLPEGELPTGFRRGWVVLDRDKLRRVEVSLAIAEAYASEMTGREDDDTTALYEFYRREADMLWRQQLPLRIDRGAQLADHAYSPKGYSWQPTRGGRGSDDDFWGRSSY
jgi:hypothetical protein